MNFYGNSKLFLGSTILILHSKIIWKLKHFIAGSSQAVGSAKDQGLADNDISRIDPFVSGRPHVGPSSVGSDYFQGLGTQCGSQSCDLESPSSLDSKAANSQSQEKRDAANWDKQMKNQSGGRKITTKRKRGDTSLPLEPHDDNLQQLDSRNTVVNPRKGKMNKVESSSGFPVKGGEQANFSVNPSGSQMEHFSSLSGGKPMLRSKQDSQHSIEKQLDSTNNRNMVSQTQNAKYPEEVEVSSSHNPSEQQRFSSLPSTHDIMSIRNQNKTGLPFEKSQIPKFSSPVVHGNMAGEIQNQPSTAPSPSKN